MLEFLSLAFPGYMMVAMSVVEDLRTALQDFISPELRELKTRVDDLEKNMESGFAHVDRRFEQVDRRFDDLTRHLDHRFNSLEVQLHLSERVARLEQSQADSQKKQ